MKTSFGKKWINANYYVIRVIWKKQQKILEKNICLSSLMVKPLTFNESECRFESYGGHMINKTKYAYQRITRGFSDKDAWNGDKYLASQIAGILRWHVKSGRGIANAYLPNKIDYSEFEFDLAVAARDSEYLNFADIFDEYAKNGPALNKRWKKDFGGVLDKDMKKALQWLSEHFQELWD